MNILCATGNLGRDAEMRATPAGKQVLSFSVPMKAGWGDREQTVWLNCSLWGDRGAKLAEYLTKGTMVAVSGELSVREYEKDGVMKTSIELNVRDVTLCGGGHREAAPANAVKPSKSVMDEFEDTEIPF